MKKVIAAICGIVAIAAIWYAGFLAGVRHAIEDSRIYADDSIVFIDLDGQVYEHRIN